MNNKGEANPKSIVIGLIVFSLIIASGLAFMKFFIQSYEVAEPSNFDTIQTMQDSYTNVTDEINDNLDNRTWYEQVTDRLYDVAFGGVLKPILVIKDSGDLFNDYITILSSELGIDNDTTGFIITFVSTLLVMIIAFAVIYFIRSGK